MNRKNNNVAVDSLKTIRTHISQVGRNYFVTERKVKVCPRCGSPEIREATSSIGGWLVPKTYYCESEDCGYSGPLFVEVEASELKEFRKAMNGEK